jgi:hypothetical protein
MAEDYTDKRRDLASIAVDAATDIVRGVQALMAMSPELKQVGGGFVDSDFEGNTSLKHVNAWKMNTLITIVAPVLQQVADAPISQDTKVTHADILFAVKRAR